MTRSLAVVAGLAVPLWAWAVPIAFTHQGRVLDSSGDPLTGQHQLTVALYDAETGGAPTWQETHTVDVISGYYALVLGVDGSNPIEVDALDVDALWLDVAVDVANPVGPRQRVLSVPYAVLADTSTNVVGGVVDATSIRVGGVEVIDGAGQIDWSNVDGPDASALFSDLGCADGDVLYFDAGWGCRALDAHGHDAGDLATGTVAIDRLPTGTTADTVAFGAHDHDALDVVSGKLALDRLPTGTTADTVALGLHAHDAAAIATGTLDIGRIPVGTTAGTVAAGVHTHGAADVTSGVLAIGRIPVGTTAGTVAAGEHTHALTSLTGTLGVGQLPTLAPVAFTGAYADLTGAPQVEERFLRGADLTAGTGSGTGVLGDALVLLAGGYGAGLTDLVVADGTTVTLPPGTHEYASVTVGANATLTVDPWNGTEGGTVDLRVRGAVTIAATGKVDVSGKGYRGGRAEWGYTGSAAVGRNGQPGESYLGWYREGGESTGGNVAGGGAGGFHDHGNWGCAGAGGGYATAGTSRTCNTNTAFVAAGGATYGDAVVTTLYLGSGGGSAGSDEDHRGRGGHGGAGGGAVRIQADTLTLNGSILANGAGGTGPSGDTSNQGGGGGGSGGSIKLVARSLVFGGGSSVQALGGSGAAGAGGGTTGGPGGNGRVRYEAGTVSGTTTTQAGSVSAIDGAQYGTGDRTYGTWTSPAVTLDGGRFTQVDLFARRAEGVTLVAELCTAQTAGELPTAPCVPVAPSGAVDAPGGHEAGQLRLTVWDRSGAGAFALTGVRFVGTR